MRQGSFGLSVRSKLLALGGVGLLVAVAVALVGFSSVSGLSSSVTVLSTGTVAPLGSFAALRDAEGDSRVNVWRYVDPTADRASVAKDMSAADAAVETAVQGFLTSSGVGPRADLMRQFEAAHQTWIHVRDTKVRPLADAGKYAAANAAVSGVLADADATMSKPLDDLAPAEQAEATSATEQARSDATRARLLIALALLVGLAVAGGFGMVLSARMMTAMAVVSEGLARLARGDLTWHRPPARGRDQLAAMADLAQDATDALRGIVTRLDSTAATVTEAVGSLGAASAGLSTDAANAVSQVDDAASEISLVSRSVQTVASGSEQMTASINEIASSAQEAARIAQSGVDAAERTDHQVRQLGESSAEIMTIVRVITSIAEQTNLLALNATIEAARAGESGKGFAVVAGEVKELANETARATEQITARVQAIQTDTSSVVASITGIRQVIERINEMQITVAGAVEEQSATTAEINRSVTQAAANAEQVAQRVDAVADTTRQTEGHVRTTQDSSARLAELADALATEVRAFTL